MIKRLKGKDLIEKDYIIEQLTRKLSDLESNDFTLNKQQMSEMIVDYLDNLILELLLDGNALRSNWGDIYFKLRNSPKHVSDLDQIVVCKSTINKDLRNKILENLDKYNKI
jgi:hypothetical protein